MEKICVVAFLVSGIFISFDGSSVACPGQGKNVIWEDDFKEFDPSWGKSDELFFMQDGRAALKVAAATFQWRVNSAAVYDDFDLCVTVSPISSVAPSSVSLGLMFWQKDKDNFYVFVVDANGNAAIERKQNGHWTLPMGWSSYNTLIKGDSKANTLRVVARSNQVDLVANGQPLSKFKGSPPPIGSRAGLFASASKNAAAIFGFKDFKSAAPEKQ